MPSPEEWKRKLEALIEAGKAVDKAISEGVHIPVDINSLGLDTGTLGLGLKTEKIPQCRSKCPGLQIDRTFQLHLPWTLTGMTRSGYSIYVDGLTTR